LLVDLGVLTSAALLISLLFARLGLPIVAGQVVAGMLVGPFGLNLLRDTQAVAEIASIGVVLLLFTIGLELDPFQLGRMAGKVVSLTALEMAMAASMAAPAALLLGLKPLEDMASLWRWRYRAPR
jgi:Kef-type K+ transport system membrane component KefB